MVEERGELWLRHSLTGLVALCWGLIGCAGTSPDGAESVVEPSSTSQADQIVPPPLVFTMAGEEARQASMLEAQIRGDLHQLGLLVDQEPNQPLGEDGVLIVTGCLEMEGKTTLATLTGPLPEQIAIPFEALLEACDEFSGLDPEAPVDEVARVRLSEALDQMLAALEAAGSPL